MYQEKVCTADLKTETVPEKSMQILYFLSDGLCSSDGAIGKKVYGVDVQLQMEGKTIDKCTVSDVSSNKEEVVRLIELMAKNSVTPVSVMDVLQDLLAKVPRYEPVMKQGLA